MQHMTRKLQRLVISPLLVFSLAACGGAASTTTSAGSFAPAGSSEASVTATTSATAPDDAATTAIEPAAATDVPASPSTEATAAASVAETASEHSETHDDAADYVWEDSAVVPLVLDGESVSVDGDGVTVDGSIVTITAAGTYSLRGSLANGQIVVNTEDEAVVRLIPALVFYRRHTLTRLDLIAMAVATGLAMILALR